MQSSSLRTRPLTKPHRKRTFNQPEEAPFPIPIETVTHKAASNGHWFYYEAQMVDGNIIVQNEGDIVFLHKMGFFGKGILSRSKPEHHFFASSFQGLHRRNLPPKERRFQQQRFQQVRQHKYERHLSWSKQLSSQKKLAAEELAQKDAASTKDPPSSPTSKTPFAPPKRVKRATVSERNFRAGIAADARRRDKPESRDGRWIQGEKEPYELCLQMDSVQSGVHVFRSGEEEETRVADVDRREVGKVGLRQADENMTVVTGNGGGDDDGRCISHTRWSVATESNLSVTAGQLTKSEESNLEWGWKMPSWRLVAGGWETRQKDSEADMGVEDGVERHADGGVGEGSSAHESDVVNRCKESDRSAPLSWDTDWGEWADVCEGSEKVVPDSTNLSDQESVVQGDFKRAILTKDGENGNIHSSKKRVFEQPVRGVHTHLPCSSGDSSKEGLERSGESNADGVEAPLSSEAQDFWTEGWSTNPEDWDLGRVDQGRGQRPLTEQTRTRDIKAIHGPNGKQEKIGNAENQKVVLMRDLVMDQEQVSEEPATEGQTACPTQLQPVDGRSRESFQGGPDTGDGTESQACREGQNCSGHEEVEDRGRMTMSGEKTGLTDVHVHASHSPPHQDARGLPGDKQLDSGASVAGDAVVAVPTPVEFDNATTSQTESNNLLSLQGRTMKKKMRDAKAPVRNRDPYPIVEYLQLSFEEAFFLSYGLGCLSVVDASKKPMDLTEMWRTFRRHQPSFLRNYIVYHYFRSKGWVPKTGLKFGADFILYKKGPPFYHASYCVRVTMVNEEDIVGGGMTKMTWNSLIGMNRVIEGAAKELMFCFVIQPSALSKRDLDSPACIPHFKVQEMLMHRWIPSREREARTEGEVS